VRESTDTAAEPAGRAAMEEIIEALSLSDGGSEDGERLPILDAASISAALVDRRGRVLSATPAFSGLGAERLLDADLLRRAGAGAQSTAVLEVPSEDGEVDTAVFAYAPATRALRWRLPEEVRAAAVRAPSEIVVLTSHLNHIDGPLETACRAYRLSGLQSRVTCETIRAGSVKAAAKKAGVSYHTARQSLAEVMQRVHAPRLPALVHKLASLAFGVIPDESAAEVLCDMWGLTPRQADIAVLVASGMSRAEAARATGLSAAVVNKELDQVHLLLQVRSAAALARKIVEANALRWLTRATHGDVGFIDSGAEPLQFVHRPDGSRIALSDYGPVSGRPVLVAHTAMTTRIVPRGLLRALHRAGFRPISIDRPGFGLTDEIDGARPGHHDPFATAAADALLVLKHLKIQEIDVVVRASAPFALALQAAASERLRRVVLVNPSLPLAEDRRQTGLFGALKQVYRRNPAMIRIFVTALARELTYERFSRALPRMLRGSAPDEAAAMDAELMGDHFRAQRMFATGRIAGVVNEHTAIVQGSGSRFLGGAASWQVLVGAHDTLHDPDDVLAYWRGMLPDAQFRKLPDAGRLLAFSHPHYVVEALQDDGR
jgi:pimeloyl-ACP methyl ester carboxylesterase/DNA-binding CsgD family transcriptional regulator